FLSRGFVEFVANVTLPRLPTQLADGIANLVERQVVDRSRFGDDVLLDHQAPHIVGPVEQSELPDFEALRYPARLDVGEIVQIQPRDRLRFEIVERARGRDVLHLRVLWLEGPTNESRVAMRFVLSAAQALEMLHPFGNGLDVAEHHRGGT